MAKEGRSIGCLGDWAENSDYVCNGDQIYYHL